MEPEKIVATAVQAGKGTVRCAHGELSVPAPGYRRHPRSRYPGMQAAARWGALHAYIRRHYPALRGSFRGVTCRAASRTFASREAISAARCDIMTGVSLRKDPDMDVTIYTDGAARGNPGPAATARCCSTLTVTETCTSRSSRRGTNAPPTTEWSYWAPLRPSRSSRRRARLRSILIRSTW